MSKKMVWLLAFVMISVFSFSGCGTNESKTNHTIIINNAGSNTIECSARQFTLITVEPTDSSSSELKYTFVSNPNTTISVGIKIPKTGFYKLTFSLYEGGPSIWWDSIALQTGSTTDVVLSTNNVGFYDNSYVAGIRSSGNDIPKN